jgi:hypothetical protein
MQRELGALTKSGKILGVRSFYKLRYFAAGAGGEASLCRGCRQPPLEQHHGAGGTHPTIKIVLSFSKLVEVRVTTCLKKINILIKENVRIFPALWDQRLDSQHALSVQNKDYLVLET